MKETWKPATAAALKDCYGWTRALIYMEEKMDGYYGIAPLGSARSKVFEVRSKNFRSLKRNLRKICADAGFVNVRAAA